MPRFACDGDNNGVVDLERAQQRRAAVPRMSHGGRGPPALGVGRVALDPPSGAARVPAPSGSE